MTRSAPSLAPPNHEIDKSFNSSRPCRKGTLLEAMLTNNMQQSGLPWLVLDVSYRFRGRATSSTLGTSRQEAAQLIASPSKQDLRHGKGAGSSKFSFSFTIPLFFMLWMITIFTTFQGTTRQALPLHQSAVPVRSQIWDTVVCAHEPVSGGGCAVDFIAPRRCRPQHHAVALVTSSVDTFKAPRWGIFAVESQALEIQLPRSGA